MFIPFEWLSIKCLRRERCFKNRTADLRKTLHRRVYIHTYM